MVNKSISEWEYSKEIFKNGFIFAAWLKIIMFLHLTIKTLKGFTIFSPLLPVIYTNTTPSQLYINSRRILRYNSFSLIIRSRDENNNWYCPKQNKKISVPSLFSAISNQFLRIYEIWIRWLKFLILKGVVFVQSWNGFSSLNLSPFSQASSSPIFVVVLKKDLLSLNIVLSPWKISGKGSWKKIFCGLYYVCLQHLYSL